MRAFRLHVPSLTIIVGLLIVYAAGTFLDRSIVCNHLPSGLALDIHECRVTFWWLGLLWPLTLLHILTETWWTLVLTVAVLIGILLVTTYDANRAKQKTRLLLTVRSSIAVLVGSITAVALYALLSFALLGYGIYGIGGLIVVLLLAGTGGAGAMWATFQLWKRFGTRPAALIFFWLPIIIFLFVLAVYADIALRTRVVS